MLRERHRDIQDIRFLEVIPPQKACIHLTGNGNNRNGIHESRRQASHQIRRSRPGSSKADTYPARNTGVAIRCMSRVLLMGDNYFLQLVLYIIQSIVKRQDHAAGIAKNRAHALFQQALHNSLGSSHLHGITSLFSKQLTPCQQ